MVVWQQAFTETQLHYTRSGGQGPSLILAHGYTDNGLCWTRTAQALEADYDVIMPDARGHGLSPTPATDYTSEQHAADLANLITALKLDKPVVIGHSMGAINALYLAARYPDLVGAIVMVDPPLRSEDEERPVSFWHDWKANVARLQQRSREALIAQCQADNPGWHPLEVDAWAQSKLEFDLETFDRYRLASRPWQEALAEVQCPALLISAEDGIVTPEAAQEALRINPKLKSPAHRAGRTQHPARPVRRIYGSPAKLSERLMIYEIHLYVPKRAQLTPTMLEWLFENGQRSDVPEAYWPVCKIKPHVLARRLLRLDPRWCRCRGLAAMSSCITPTPKSASYSMCMIAA